MAIRIPETILYKVLRTVVDVVKEDFETITDKKKTLLWFFFGEDEFGERLEFETFDFFDQSVSILTKKGDEVRALEITIGYNLNRAAMPTIHILLPSETPINSGIGSNEGFQEPIVDTQRNETIPVLTQDSSVTYNLLITSDNMHEVLVLYHFLKGAFLSFKSQLELRGLQNATFGGQDIQFDEGLVPTHVFHRNFNLSFTYDFSVPDIFSRKFGTEFKIESIAQENS